MQPLDQETAAPKRTRSATILNFPGDRRSPPIAERPGRTADGPAPATTSLRAGKAGGFVLGLLLLPGTMLLIEVIRRLLAG